ncbi:MAG: hypothetical protein WA376_15280, partial [Terrimicrobiaceae bacterium]
MADLVGLTDRHNTAAAGSGSTRVSQRLACNCPASSPDRFRDEAGDIAAVVFAMRMIALSYPSLPLRLRGNRRLCPAWTPGTTPG